MATPRHHRQEEGMVPRVAVLETTVDTLHREFHGFRKETIEWLGKLGSSMDQLLQRQTAQEARTPRNTNWYAVAGFVVATITIVGAVFSLAEWRVGVAFDPLKEALREQRRELHDATKRQMDLELSLAREQVIRELTQKNAASGK